jgi:hypothetical protein
MRIPLRRTSVPVVAIALLSAFSIVGPAPASAAPPATATFNPNLLLPGSNGAAEPSIKTDRLGRSFVIGPTGSQCNAMRVSHDGSSATFLGAPDHNLGGGDCDWAIGPQETGSTTDSNIAYSSLDNLANITVGKSSDGGNTFGPPNPAAAQIGGDDRMWMVPDPKLNSSGKNTVFLDYHDISLVDIEMSISTDGGQTYVQSGPIINNSDVPQGQWQGLGALAGNELGNLVARRDPVSNVLTLYSIFQTPDSPADNVTQGANMTANYNRVYEAVGTVTDVLAPAPPTISWRNYEIFHGPAGVRYNRIFPVTAVDAAGRVYAFWSDGNQIDVKTDATGTGWSAEAAPRHIPNPAGVNTAIMPWAEAGARNVADVVFYGASGGSGAQPNPQDDPNNTWNAYMAQTVDGGRSWGVFKASDHAVHHGPLCIDGLNCNLVGNRDRTLLDFFQVTVDPTNGAADIAYADDHASPGSAVMYYTRQCTGISATTGAALVNDCQVPPPPPPLPQGSTCPGPQVVDFVGDAPNNYPGGDGANMDNLDIVNAFFGTPDTSHIQVTLTINNLSAPPPPVNMISAYWTVYWTFNGTKYYAQATSNGVLYNFSDGTYTTTFNPVGTPTGTVTTGHNGTIVMTVPRGDIGNPANDATLNNTVADTHGSFTVGGSGVYYTAAADRAPNSGYGANYVVGQTCSQPTPVPASLTLAPKTQTDTVGSQACVTATVKDATGAPVAGVTVRFSVGGSVTTNGSATTSAAGQAQFCYTGPSKPGKDQVKAYADTNNNGVQDPGEPSDTATVTWVSPTPPPCHEGDGEGDVHGSQSGTAHVSSDEDSCEDQDQEQVKSQDPGASKDFQSTQIQSVQFDDATKTVTIFGLGVTGGNAVSFVLVETASGPNTPGSISLSLSDGYVLAGSLLSGTIMLR